MTKNASSPKTGQPLTGPPAFQVFLGTFGFKFFLANPHDPNVHMTHIARHFPRKTVLHKALDTVIAFGTGCFWHASRALSLQDVSDLRTGTHQAYE